MSRPEDVKDNKSQEEDGIDVKEKYFPRGQVAVMLIFAAAVLVLTLFLLWSFFA